MFTVHIRAERWISTIDLGKNGAHSNIYAKMTLLLHNPRFKYFRERRLLKQRHNT